MNNSIVQIPINVVKNQPNSLFAQSKYYYKICIVIIRNGIKSVYSNAHSSRQYLYQIKPVHVFQKIRSISLQNLVGGFRPPIYQVHHYFLFLALLTSVLTCKQRVYPDVNPDSLIGGINTRYAIGHKMLNTVCRI